MNDSPIRVRTQKLVRPRTQIRIITAFFAVACTAVLVQTLTLNMTMVKLSKTLPTDQSILLDAWPMVLLTNVLIGLGLLVPLCLGVGILVTFRVVGPIHNLGNYLGNIIAGGEPGTCRFREGDAFQELPELMNRAVKTLRDEQEDKGTTVAFDSRRAA